MAATAPAAIACPRLTRALLPAFLSTIDTFLLDCDGVLWTGATPVPGAGAAVDALRGAGKRVFFVTNNSTKPRAAYVDTLAKFGITAPPTAVLSSAYASAVWLAARGVKRVYLIGEPGLAAELAGAGVSCEGPEDWGKPFSLGAAEGPAPLDPAVGAVVCGFDGRFCCAFVGGWAAVLRAARAPQFNRALPRPKQITS